MVGVWLQIFYTKRKKHPMNIYLLHHVFSLVTLHHLSFSLEKMLKEDADQGVAPYTYYSQVHFTAKYIIDNVLAIITINKCNVLLCTLLHHEPYNACRYICILDK